MDSDRYVGKLNRTHAAPDGGERCHAVGPSNFPPRMLSAPAVSEQTFHRSNDAMRRSPSQWYSAQSQYSPSRHYFESSGSRHASPSASSSSQFSPYARPHDDRSRFTPFRGGANKGMSSEGVSRMKGNEGSLAESYSVVHGSSTHWKAKLSRHHVSSSKVLVKHTYVSDI